MKIRLALVVMLATLAAGFERAVAADADGSAALAERLANFAHQTLRPQKLPPYALNLSAALYRAAARLNPNEPRFLRSLADNLLEMNDVAGAMDALGKYILLAGDDQTAQVQLLDLHLASGQLQSADAKLAYLQKPLQMSKLPAPVRSEVALRCAQVYAARGQNAEVLKMLTTALQLNPLNLGAMRAKYALTQSTATPVDRVMQLLAILQANPTDAVVCSRLGEQMAQLGLLQQSIIWYGFANTLYHQTGVHADAAFALGASSALFMTGRADEAANLAGQYVGTFPNDADGWFLALTIAKYKAALDKSDAAAQTAEAALERQACNALGNRLAEIRAAAGDKTATTRPIDAATEMTLPNLTHDVSLVKAMGNEQLTSDYVEAAASLAWLDLYYRATPSAADPLLDVLGQLLPEKDERLARLRAWRQYRGEGGAVALAALQALADKDPLSALGVLLIDKDARKRDRVLVEGRKLLDAYPSGVIGAAVWAEVNPPFALTVEPLPGAQAVTQLPLDKLSQEIFQIVNRPQTSYMMHVDALKAQYEYGEPVLVRISVVNIGDQGLAIGEDCALHPTLWLDAFLPTMGVGIPGAAIGRLDQRLALAPGQSVSTVLRVDQDGLYQIFTGGNGPKDVSPQKDLFVNLTLVSNPTGISKNTPDASPQASPGLCGQSVQLSKLIERVPTPIDLDVQCQQLLQRLGSGDGDEKIQTMDVVARYISMLRPKTETAAVAENFFAHLRQQDAADGLPVRVWRRFLLAMLAGGNDQIAGVNDLAQDSNWQARLLAMLVAQQWGVNALPLAQGMCADSDAGVADYAKALVKSINVSATQPAPATRNSP